MNSEDVTGAVLAVVLNDHERQPAWGRGLQWSVVTRRDPDWEREQSRDKRQKRRYRQPALSEEPVVLPSTAEVLHLPELSRAASDTPRLLRQLAEYRQKPLGAKIEVNFQGVRAVDAETIGDPE